MSDIGKDKTIPGRSRSEEKRKKRNIFTLLVFHSLGSISSSCIFYCIKDKQQVIWLKECLPQTEERRIWIEEPTKYFSCVSKVDSTTKFRIKYAVRISWWKVFVFSVCMYRSILSKRHKLKMCLNTHARRTHNIYYKYTRITNIYVHTFE